MDYNHITKFLEKFKKIIFQKEETKEIIKKIISFEVSHQIESDNIKTKNGNIYIQESPIIRNEVLIKKKNILFKLKEAIPGSSFIDIK